jgi:branched-subunit amino acid transport protein
MNKFWIATIGTSVIAYLIKFSGTLIPAKVLESKSVRRINALLPIAMLSALVAVQAFAISSEKNRSIGIDHRAAGLLVAAIALRAKAGFPIVVGSAALVSALIVRLH